MPRERERAGSLGAPVLAATFAAVVVLGCSCCFSDDNAVTLEPAGPYSGQTADDVWKETRTASQNTDKHTPVGLPGLGSLVKMLLWVGVVIVFIYAVVHVLRRYVPSARNMFGSGIVKVVGRTYVSSKQCLLLVKVGSKFVVVGVTGTSMSPLAEISNPDEAHKLAEELAAQSGQSIASSFRRSLNEADRDYVDEGMVSDGVGETELSGVREELDAVAQKMTWWRSRAQT